MAEVGKSTGKKTQAGREVYETPDGEMVSEKSTTFKYKGKWINVPTIHNGYAYDDDILRMMLDAEVIEPTSIHKSKEDAIKSAIERSKSLKFDEGGLASQTEEALGWAAEGKKLAVDIPEVSFKDAATFVAEMTPIVGDALAAKEVYDELQKDEPNYYLAGALGGAALVGLVPGLGDAAAKAIKKGAREVFDAGKRLTSDKDLLDGISKYFKKKETDNIPEDLPAYDDAGNLDSVLTDEGVVDEIAELQAQKDSGMFNTETDILSAWQAGILNESEYLDETYKVLKNKLKYLEPPKGGKAPEWSDYGKTKKFVDVYDAVGKNKIIQLAKDYPQDVDLINKYHAKLGEYADELGIEPENLIDVVQDSKAIVGYTPLTEVDLPKAVDTGDIYPRKATEYSRDPLAMPPAMTAADKAGHNLGFKDTVYHLAVNEDEFTNFKNIDEMLPELGEGPTDKFRGVAHDLLGVHVGTARAAAERNKIKSADVFSKDRPRFTMELKARLDKPVRPEELADRVGLDRRELTLTDNELHFTEGDLKNIIKQKARQMNPGESYISDTMRHKAAIALRKELAKDGYTHIPYENNVEDMESISYIMLVDRPKDSASVLRDSRAKFDPDQVTSTDLRLAQGGAVGNMSMKKQMSLFEYGGIADDGMNKDPVSGNNVPPGSLAKEVRDDIPAMLSEGEYVVPADVLRYYGVNFFENLRGQAKQGLNTMEQNGRIGGTPMTQQDVARNMQQPMTPAPVQAAQGAMMQSPMRVQQQQAPQAVGNSGIPTQGYAGEDGSIVSRWSPARARYSSPMFQGTSSQQANIQTAQEQAATESITYMRTHYNQNGESVQIAYEGTDPASATPKAGQDQLLSDYPLTEEEWAAYKSEMSKNTGDGGGSGGGGDTTVSSGSDTSWMSGINFDSQADVKAWVDSAEGLGMSGLAKNVSERGGILGAIPQAIQAQDIAKVRGLAEIYKELNPELSAELTKKANDAVNNSGSLVISALDKLGLLSGDNYSNDPELQKRVQFGQETQTETAKILGDSGGSGDDDDPFVTPTVFEKGDVVGTVGGEDVIATQAGTKYTFTEDPDDDDSVFDDIDAQFEAAGVANNTGGLMVSTRSKKKKSKPKKTGLAGKK